VTVDVAEMRSVMERLLAQRNAERIDRLFRRKPNLKRAALSSTSQVAIRARDMVKMMGLP
jgi:hypothetical protein